MQVQRWPSEAFYGDSRTVSLILVDPLHHNHLMVHLHSTCSMSACSSP